MIRKEENLNISAGNRKRGERFEKNRDIRDRDKK